jgi:diguanylate cyclase (GGDEF)-like protein
MHVSPGKPGPERDPSAIGRADSKVVSLRPDLPRPPAAPAAEEVADTTNLRENQTARLLCSVEEVLAQPNPWLAFPADLERRFEQDNLPRRSREQLIKGATALALFDLFLVSDLSMVPDVFRQMLWLRLVIVTPIALCALFVLALTPRPRTTEAIVSCISILTTSTILFGIANSHHPFASYYHTGIPLIVIFANIVQRARFWYAAGTSVAILLLYILVAQLTQTLPQEILQNYEMVLASTVLFTLVANYNLERDERRAYLMTLRENLRNSNLEDANAQLTRLSEIDPLTDLANRRSFERQLKQAWMRHLALRQPLSLIMIDIDHFKLYNDRLGHPAGDQCLKQVADAIRHHVRSTSGELAARLGGEEFAVLLPGLSEERSEEVAQRIRSAVQGLRIPHEAVADDGVVTVSVGAATAEGSRYATPQRLVERADNALYLAKRGGRNRVRLASPVDS